MNDRVHDKINEIEEYLEELYSIVPSKFEVYRRDFKSKAACERFVEKIIEAVTDLGFLVIKSKCFDMPESDLHIFEILLQKNIISDSLSKKLRNAKSMRNIIAHEYGKVDDEIVFQSITEELKNDINEFLDVIKKLK